MQRFAEALPLDKLPPGTGIALKIAEDYVALFNVDGTVYAIGNSCPHAGGSLGGGKLEGTTVTCRMHGMKFDVTTGFFHGTSSYGVATHQVKIIEGKIFVDLGS